MIGDKSYYQILNIERNSSVKQIKLAFKKQIRKHHPDKHFSSTAFQLSDLDTPGPKNLSDKKNISMMIIQAYQCLSNQQKRSIYDQKLKSQEMKSQLYSLRHKDQISISSHKQEKQSEKADKFENRDFQTSSEEGSDSQDSESVVLVCQQCFGQMQIPTHEFSELHKKQLSVNCAHCGLYINIVQ